LLAGDANSGFFMLKAKTAERGEKISTGMNRQGGNFESCSSLLKKYFSFFVKRS